ncbi:non-ribosomal peptide synthetase [Streptomyces paludis]|uniref:Amino acid adenylation domain-containing protein n=1 Tax=Streptomyces paludis TaxID=2282738 RepID=A0A345HIP8_9ACTN|nr:non-ribosomal peptide synthetase [Streptomyces paludis]AXG76572.1 amino acid adenylation domain-containing protein [Streptomyces paludis]
MTSAVTAPDGAPDRTTTTGGLAAAVLARARRHPAAVAVTDGEQTLTYAELADASGAVARALHGAGIRPGEAVAVCLPRSWRLVCAMLGLLRLGAVVVPLDAQSPPERRGHILADSGAVALIHGDGTPGLPEGLPGGVRPLDVTVLLGAGPADGREPPAPAPLPAVPATAPPVSFVFYTSGTTGRPKGVEVRDAGVLRLARPGYLDLPEGARYSCLANPAFDALSFEVWVPLLTGGRCVILPDETVQTPHLLAAALRRERVDTVFITVALFNAVVIAVPDCFAGAGQVLVGGEQLNARLIRRWYRDNPTSRTRLHNVYGPTETTTFALCHPVPRDFTGDVVPIGRPLPETGTLLLVDGGRPAAPGEVAELLLSGAGLAAGYRGLPEETGRAFVTLPRPDGDGGDRYYRTGDLVRGDTDGRITYVGRADRQVKVRGFRIEPGELEQRIVAHPAVRQAYVCTRRDPADGGNELLAHVVLGADLSFEEFDRHLAAGLPAYMRPHRVHLVESLPLNANGKVDEAALLRWDLPPWRGTAPGPGPDAVTPWQREVLELAGEVLGVPGLRLGDRWTANGGDSLKALRLRFEVRRRWGREVPQTLVLGEDFAALAAAIGPDGRAGADTVSPYPAVPAPTGARSGPTTSEQQRLWLLQQRDPRSTAYNVPLAFRLRGTVDTAALRHALRRLVARHPALRTSYEATPDGLRQVVAEPYDPWTERALPGPGDTGTDDGALALAAELGSVPFDLTDPRLLEACWLPSDDGGVLLLRLHHIAVDGWSLNVLFRSLSEDYAAASAGAPPPGTGSADSAPTPLDHAVWQAEWFTRPGYLAQRAALRTHHAGSAEAGEPLEPAGSGAAVRPDARGRLLHTSLDRGRRAVLDRLGAELGLTRFQLLLAVFSWSLYGVTGRARPRIAGPVANRPVEDFADSVGMFANTVLLPQSPVPEEDLRTLLRRQGDEVRAVLDLQDVALADALADRAFPTEGGPFDFLFVLENTDFSALSLPGCDSRPLWPAPAHAKCPLTLSVVEREEGFDCLWEYDADSFEAPEVRAMDGLFRQALDRLAESAGETDEGVGEEAGGHVGQAGGPVTLADLVGPYRRSLDEPGRALPAPPGFATVAEGFARQVRLRPDAIALVSAGREVSYGELDALADALARELWARHPLPPGDDPTGCVALHFEPSVEHVVALLACARLNLTVVPLDPAYPPALLRQIMDQVDPLCVLLAADSEGAFDAVDPGGPLPRLTVTAELSPEPASGPPPEPPRDLPPYAGRPLYTLFTSGSTGTPKGVRVPDRTLCDLLRWQSGPGGLPDGAVTAQFSALSFDVSFQEIFSALCGGGTLHLARPGLRQDVPALLAHLEVSGAERVFMPYVALQLLAEYGVRLGRYPSRLRDVVTAGEQLVCTDAIRRWFAGLSGARLFNHYGPTETHVVSALCLDGDPALWPARPAIGRPVAGAWLRVVDEADRPVPPGCPGRLLIGGPMAAPCYTGDPALNERHFVELPGLGVFYRSGDRARFDRQGLLHCLGRDDQQIKLSGHRLELGQVEAALLRHPALVNAVVVRDDERLTACVECRAGEPVPTTAELAGHLAPLLPAYVRIDRFRRLAALPRTPSGKLDRRAALHAPGEELDRGQRPGPELSAREARLSALFEEVLGRPIGRDQRFFDAGASSLDLMRFHLRCTAELDLPLTIPDLFEHVTVRRLARFLDASDPAVRDDRAPGGTGSGGPADEPVAVVGMAVRLPGATDLAGFWAMVNGNGRGIEHFDAADGLVGARSMMDGPLAFDPRRFGIGPAEARLMDPQQRHLMMSCAEALAHAGIADPDGRGVGLVAGCGENTYFQSMLREADPERLPDRFQLALHHDKDFLATKTAYHLGLTGPAFTVQAACASSLVAVHVAAGMLRQGDAEVMLAGGVLVDTTLSDGYAYRPQHILSPDGYCRPFSDDSDGTIGASGVGVVVLKPLSAARRDGDTVYAVITGSALNNDGSAKIGYSAPSLPGQREVIRTALRRSGRSAAELGYVEAHGTGTRLGDPVEVGALRQAFGLESGDGDPGSGGDDRNGGGDGGCALSSVKSQIGHLGAAAGVVGLVRAALAVHHGVIPPNVGFRQPNPRIGADAAPFRFPAEAAPWPAGRDRVAAVSSFGIGGTNAHLILEAADLTSPVGPSASSNCLLLSGDSEVALRADAARVADYLAARPQAYGQVLRHLQAGRPAGRLRMGAVCADAADAVAWLRTAAGAETAEARNGVAAVEVVPGEEIRPAGDRSAAALTAAWLAGERIGWPEGPAQAPWDFPPPAFELADYDFERAAPGAAEERTVRLPESDWLHQPHWVRRGRATAVPRVSGVPGSPGPLVVLTASEPLGREATRLLEAVSGRVVRVVAAGAFARLADGTYEVDPADPASLRQLLDALAGAPDGAAAEARIDWLHALPLAINGPVGEDTLDRAHWACVDTPAALLSAVAGMDRPPRLRPWWLSYGAQPVEGFVDRPEAGLLAGVCEVAPQERGVEGHWLDLPGADPAEWAAPLSALLAETSAGSGASADGVLSLPRRLALRQGFWWQQALLPVAASPSAGLPPDLPPLLDKGGVHLLLGGTGGIGAALAARLLEGTDHRVVLLARHPRVPAALSRWADRIELVDADLAETSMDRIHARIARIAPRLDSVIHTAGTASGGLITHRDPGKMRRATAGKARGALLTERLIESHRPSVVVYCSSMSAQFGGVGQLDYAAANGLLDGFARRRPGAAETTLRIGVDWDIWREVGMARHALRTDARHQEHLAVGLEVAEGQRVFDRALRLQLPQLLVSTTAVERARDFYAPPATTPDTTATAAVTAASTEQQLVEQLTEWLRDWLGLDRLDPDASLYELGADSLTLLDLIGEVKRLFGVDIELSQLNHRASLADVLARLDEETRPAAGVRSATGDPVELEIWQEGEGDGRDVLCLVHPVGGDIQAYRTLVSALDPRLTVCLIADPALRLPGLPAWSLAERARRYHAAFAARFPAGQWRRRLAGWSFGGWAALGMAAEAEAADEPVAGLYLLDPPPPDAGEVFRTYDERGLEAVFAHELNNASAGTGTGADAGRGAGPEARAYAERLAHCCRANVAAMAAYELPRLSRTPSRLWLANTPVDGLPPTGTPDELRRQWQAWLPDLTDCQYLDTTHYGVLGPPHVAKVARTVNST